MSNPLFERFGAMMGGNVPGPLQNVSNFMSSFAQFRNGLNGNDTQSRNEFAKQQVQQMLNNGQITQEQLNQVMQYAGQIQKFIR